ncbi:MAG: site-specific DNA-methyltransferase [Rhodospirillaceae bacterium]|nr:site-specific DNA-methyltransferase [Rhodospirillaceae bacterium]
MKIASLPLEDLIPYASNSRTHSDEQVAQIAASISEFGFNNPVLIDEAGGIIAGHGRVLAARKLGLTDIPTIRLTHLTENQRKAYVIADNKLALNAGWDMGVLQLEMQALDSEGFDLSLLGFDETELISIFATETEGLTDPDEIPYLPDTPVSQLGDVWLLGEHRLMCGDSTDTTNVAALLEGREADMVFTDPPWNVNYGAVEKGNAQGYKVRTILNDSMTADDWVKFCADVAVSLRSATKPGAPLYCVMSAQEWPVIDKALRLAGFHWSSSIIWAKDTLVLSRKDYHTQYEPIWYGWNAAAARLAKVPDRKQSDLWQCDRPKKSELHPTTKPVELVERAVNNSSQPGDLVLDLFGGSGTTLIAAQQTGRKACLMEMDPKYADVIVKRWQNFTGQQAKREGSGETFSQRSGVSENGT